MLRKLCSDTHRVSHMRAGQMEEVLDVHLSHTGLSVNTETQLITLPVQDQHSLFQLHVRHWLALNPPPTKLAKCASQAHTYAPSLLLCRCLVQDKLIQSPRFTVTISSFPCGQSGGSLAGLF